jgi:predicted alpha/beta-hydrolase family hydrolase
VPGLTIGGLPTLIDEPKEDSAIAFVLTHGAGGDIRGAGLTALAEGLAERGHLVLRFDLPYRAAGRKSPPAAEKSIDGFVSVLEEAKSKFGKSDWVLGGKSYGGRVASMAVANGLEAKGLVFYGYPLHPPGRPESLRVSHWPSIAVPCLFLEGTNDPFCDLKLLKKHLPKLDGKHETVVIQGGDHSLKVSGAQSKDGQARSAESMMGELAGTVSDWAKTL